MPAASSAEEVITRKGATGNPDLLRNSFSSTRSWQTRTTEEEGRTGMRSSRAFSASTVIFSNSTVATSMFMAKRSSALRSSKGATIVRSAQEEAGPSLTES